MLTIQPALLEAFRQRSFRTLPGLRLKTRDEAVAYINERGFIAFWPITGITLPSLWAAVAGDRPVPDEHDDPGHITWDWKDSLLDQRVVYYGRVLRKRNAFLSLEVAPWFYALSNNFGDIENDYLMQYEQGELTQEAKLVYEALLKEGPLDTLALRKAARLTSAESDSRFNKALDTLMADFKILPVGVAHVGRWNYAFIYEISARHFPELPEKARFISEEEARRRLIACTLQSLGALPRSDIHRLFGWKESLYQRPLEKLVSQGVCVDQAQLAGHKGEWLALKTVLDPADTAQA
ncbi:MAG TPA: crosslink repair DNA glycosylase YcaQ family protein [Anaerolineaceae bacterium]|nr:crosslink repair DNA glycosylase YcaQ family protein [Anaerolineaceae bacterium]HPN52218.1 crosslink repair DNA glycosylase YcaQ family protein [Anaerolineaceae bacterium]